jgi:hypothetical protein
MPSFGSTFFLPKKYRNNDKKCWTRLIQIPDFNKQSAKYFVQILIHVIMQFYKKFPHFLNCFDNTSHMKNYIFINSLRFFKRFQSFPIDDWIFIWIWLIHPHKILVKHPLKLITFFGVPKNCVVSRILY